MMGTKSCKSYHFASRAATAALIATAAIFGATAQANAGGWRTVHKYVKRTGKCSGEEILASYYWTGKRTATGEAFDANGNTAAARTWPLGTHLTVTNPHNGRSLTVRVNDRGPYGVAFTQGARLDLARATRIPKVHYRRLRPFVGNEAPICVQRTQVLTDSFSYPSGHATQGWAYALIMSALVPEKATAILTRGRAYGESRIVCGVHWPSDVAAGGGANAGLGQASIVVRDVVMACCSIARETKHPRAPSRCVVVGSRPGRGGGDATGGGSPDRRGAGSARWR